MNKFRADFILTTDSYMCYYGSRKNYESGNWKRLTGPVCRDELVEWEDCDDLNSIYFITTRKKKIPYVDPEFFKKFKIDE